MEITEIKQIEHVSERTLGRSIKAAQSDVAAEAESILGFKRRDAWPLLQVLKDLDIQPLNAEQVAAYKKSKEGRKRKVNNGYYRGTVTVTTTKWKSVKLSDFAGEVPLAILAKAVEIKKALPEVEFDVESLVEHKRTSQRRLPDPFLVAKHNGRSVYIDVWDEPEFESKLYA